MDEDPGDLVIGNAAGVEHDGPVDAVGRDEDILADDVGVAGPEVLPFRETRGFRGTVAEAREAGVIREGIEPDKRHVIVIEGKWNAPGEAGFRAGDAEVDAFAIAEGIDELRLAVRGKHHVRVRLEVLAQPCGVVAEAEVVVFLLAFLHETPLGTP